MAYCNDESNSKELIPATILTGFLGSGKTTLLNRILTATHGKKIAIVENEFGDVSIDDKLIAHNSKHALDTEIVEVMNGCICCTVRSDLIAFLEKLANRVAAGELALDAIVIETTGMADPSPVAQTFLMDDTVRDFFRLDGIVTLVDAKHVEQHLDEPKPPGVVNEAAAQVGFADRLLLNKIDLVSTGDLDRIEGRLRELNPYAPIHRCAQSDVSVDNVLNIHGFDLQRTLSTLPSFLDPKAPIRTKHDATVSSVSLDQGAARHLLRGIKQGPLDLGLAKEWLNGLIADRGKDLFRMKGVLCVAHAEQRYVYHSVHEIFTDSFEAEWGADEPRQSKLVFIGKNLDGRELAAGFNKCLATPENLATRAAALRFKTGDRIEVLVDDDIGWTLGTVVSTLYRNEEMPPGVLASYEIQLDIDPPGDTTYSVPDAACIVRKPGSGDSDDAEEAATSDKAGHDHGHDEDDAPPRKAQKVAQ